MYALSKRTRWQVQRLSVQARDSAKAENLIHQSAPLRIPMPQGGARCVRRSRVVRRGEDRWSGEGQRTFADEASHQHESSLVVQDAW